MKQGKEHQIKLNLKKKITADCLIHSIFLIISSGVCL